MRVLWTSQVRDSEKDAHVAFRASFTLAAPAEVELRLLGASWFVAWVDGKYLAEGPSRFPLSHPQYQSHRVRLTAGKHVLAIQVHHFGVPTRLLENPAPFVFAEAWVGGTVLPLSWKCSRIGGYWQSGKRVNAQLGWLEWCDTRQVPDWQALAYDDTPWAAPTPVERTLGPLEPLSTANVKALSPALKLVAKGSLIEAFGYEADNPQARFFLRELAPQGLPPQGVWRRYDLGRVRLARPRFVIEAPEGSVVEFAQAESLTQGRVSPWITLSASDSCNLSHFVLRGGPQEVFPLQPLGGRYLEVHVLAPPEKVRFVQEAVLERTYYGEPEGSLKTGDRLLDKIWQVGVATHRACAEDALTDNPTRERGQWAGDVVSVGMPVASVAFSDLGLFRRGLTQCAQSARADGLVSGMCPGQDIFLSTYAAQWVSACVHYHELTGEKALLEALFPAAERNIAAFEAQRTQEGVKDSLAWAFVDWGYVRNPGPSDMGLNLHYLAALRDMVRWCERLGNTTEASGYRLLALSLERTLTRYFAQEPSWEKRGYHRAALGLKLGFFTGAAEKACLAFLKAHLRRCFPNDKSAPRLSDPAAANPRLITPYFAHFAFPALIERGELDFVLEQYRRCWGWALTIEDGTWLEVFDPRWSHCHQWAGCPTWQLSRALLGLRPRFDKGKNHFELRRDRLPLPHVEGALPLPGGGVVRVWHKGERYRLETPQPLTLHLGERVVQVENRWDSPIIGG